MVHVVIVNYRTINLTLKCLESISIEVLNDGHVQVTVVENASGEAARLRAAISEKGWESWVEVIDAERNGGFSYGNNLAIAAALASAAPPAYFILLNPDTEARGNTIRTLADFMDDHPDAGIGGSSIENQDGSDWPIAFRFPSIASELEQEMRFGPISRLLKKSKITREMTHRAEPVDWVSGACMIIRRNVLDDIGLMDEQFFLYFEEVDFCLRAACKNWTCWYIPQSRIMHLSGESTGASGANHAAKRMPDYWFASRRRFFVKNHGITYACCADIAFIVGLGFFRVRNFLSGRVDMHRPRMLRDFLRTSILFHSASKPETCVSDLRNG